MGEMAPMVEQHTVRGLKKIKAVVLWYVVDA